MVSLEIGFAQNAVPGKPQIIGAHFGQKFDLCLFDEHISSQEVATISRNAIHFDSRHLHLFILKQTTGKFGLRIGNLFAGIGVRHRKQQLAFDLHEMRGHRKIFGRKFQIAFADQLHIAHVLFRNDRHRNLHDVELLPSDEIQEQIQRAFEAFQKHTQCVGRNVQTLRHLKERLTVQTRKGYAVNCFRRRILRVAGIH